MFPADIYRDLLVMCAEGPELFGGAVKTRPVAHSLLAAEQCQRLRASTRDYERGGRHPAFRDLAEETLLRGGPDAARYYAFRPSGQMAGSIPRTPITDYEESLLFLTAAANVFRGFVRFNKGDDWMDADRRVIRRGGVAAGEPFVLDPLLEMLTSPDVTLGVGAWRVQGDITVRNWDEGTSLQEIAVALDGTPIETHSAERDPPPGDDAERVMSARFIFDDELVVASPSVLTIVNASAVDAVARGIIRWWET